MMNQEFLHRLLCTTSVSGNEVPLQKVVLEEMEQYSHQLYIDGNSNVTAVLNENSNIRVLLDAHADEVGLMVTCANSSGLLYVAKVGGARLHCWAGQKVRILTDRGIVHGAIAMTDACKKEGISAKDLLIDIGAVSQKEAEDLVHTGDTVVLDTDWRMLQNNCICSRALDDKAGVFIVMEALKKAARQGCTAGVFAVSASGEETTKRGAHWAAGSIRPDMAIVVDVTFASDAPGCSDGDNGRVKLGGGPVLCHGSINSKPLRKLLEQAAKRCGIQVQHEVTPASTYTDADAIHIKNNGVPVTLVSIPLRYMHTPAEVGSLNDIQACIDLIAEFLCGLRESVELNPFE